MTPQMQEVKKLSEGFKDAIVLKEWGIALADYKIAIMKSQELPQTDQDIVFGVRGDKGVIEQQGWFPEYDVVKVMDMVLFGHPAYEEQKAREKAQESMRKKRERNAQKKS